MPGPPDEDRPAGPAPFRPAAGDIVTIRMRVATAYGTVMLVNPPGPGDDGWQKIKFWVRLEDIAGPG
jgi:hypothetical protein